MIFIFYLFLSITTLCIGMNTPSNPYLNALSNPSYPRDTISLIMQHLSFSDQITLTRTCTYLNRLPIHAQHLSPLYPKSSDEWEETVYRCGLALTYCLCPFIWKAGEDFFKYMYREHLQKHTETVYSTAIVAGAALALVVHANPSLKTTLQKCIINFIDSLDSDTQDKHRSTTQLTELTHISRNIAKRLIERRLTTHTLHIDYCSQSQAGPLFKAARTLKIPHITITVQASYNPEPFKLSSVLTQYSRLNSLQITARGVKSSMEEKINSSNLCTTLNHTNSLKKLSLSWLCISSQIIDSIIAHQTLTELSVSHNYPDTPYDFRTLAHNTTLKNLSLYECAIADSAVPHIMTFLAHNHALKSFTLSSSSLGDISKAILISSPHKPEHFEVEN